MSVAILILGIIVSYDVPPQHAIGCVAASLAHGDEPETLCAYLVSEHPGGRYSGACSDEGACGPYQLSAGWVTYAGYTWTEGDPRDGWWSGAMIAARVMEYSRERHKGCRGHHDWRAHLKCAPGMRDSCAWHVRRWLEIETALIMRPRPE